MPVRIESARFPEKIDYSATEMRALGEEVIRVMFRRWDRAQDLGDAPANPISRNYWVNNTVKPRVVKRIPFIRDLRLTGDMRRDIQVLSATTNQAIIGAATAKESAKLFYNQRRIRMFGISLKDWVEIRSWLQAFRSWALPKAA